MAIAREIKTVRKVQLELDEDEAYALAAVCARITGSKNSPRKHTDAILQALIDTGFPYEEGVIHLLSGSSLSFNNYPEVS